MESHKDNGELQDILLNSENLYIILLTSVITINLIK